MSARRLPKYRWRVAVNTYDVLGRVGLPAPVAELAARTWDVVVVGGGHNGLTAAALAASGYVGIKRVFEREYGGWLAVFGECHHPDATRTCGVHLTTAAPSPCGRTRNGAQRRWPNYPRLTWTATAPITPCSVASAGRCGPAIETCGSETLPTGRRSRSCSPATPRPSRCSSTAPSQTWSSVTCATNGCGPPYTAKGSSAPTPARETEARPLST